MNTNTTTGFDQWNQRLLSVMDSTIKSVGDAKDFVIGQLPDVIQQTLTWYMVYNLILFIIGVVSIIIVLIAWIKYSGKGAKIDPEKGNLCNHRWTLTHDNDGNRSDHVLASLCFSAIVITIAASLINLEWLKIWIAPKLWLIEYAASLAKS